MKYFVCSFLGHGKVKGSQHTLRVAIRCWRFQISYPLMPWRHDYWKTVYFCMVDPLTIPADFFFSSAVLIARSNCVSSKGSFSYQTFSGIFPRCGEESELIWSLECCLISLRHSVINLYQFLFVVLTTCQHLQSIFQDLSASISWERSNVMVS